MNPVRFRPRVARVDNIHRQFDKKRDVLVDVSTEVQHHRLGEFASANAIHTTTLLVSEDILHHTDHSTEIRRMLHHCLRAIRDVVVEGWKHIFLRDKSALPMIDSGCSQDAVTFQIQLGALLERLLNKFEDLPHCRGNRFGRKSAAVHDFESLIIEVWK